MPRRNPTTDERDENDDKKLDEIITKIFIYYSFRNNDDFYGGQKRQETDLGLVQYWK